MASIVAALKLIFSIISSAKFIIEFIESNKEEKWFRDVHEAFGDFKQKTPEERKKLAENISNIIRGL